MSKFGDSEAEEDSLDESLSEKSDDDEDEDEEEGEEEEQADDENDIINDEVEESAGEEEQGHHGHHHRKRRKADEAEELDEEDLSLIEENLGISIKRKKPRLKKIKVLDSDEEEEDQLAGNAAVKEREAIANQLFEGGDDGGEVAAEPAEAPGDDTYADIDESESEEDVDDFIVDDEGNPINRHTKKKRRIPGTLQDSALMEAQDIFGLDFDFDEFEKYGRDDFSSEEEEEDYEDDTEDGAPRRPKKKSTKKSIYEVFEPSELEKGMLTNKDNEIRTADVPERFQVRDFAVKSTEDGELDDEADWIYKHAFLDLPISQQQDPLDGDAHSHAKTPKPYSAVAKIREALNLMRNHLYEVTFSSPVCWRM